MAKKPNSSRYAAQQAFKTVSRFISSLSDEEFASLLDGSAILKIVPSAAETDHNKLKEKEYTEEEIRRIIDHLQNALTTEDGISILREATLSRTILEKIVRSLDMPVMKQDSVSRLEEKVIEGLVGSRLNSRAVRGS